MCDANGSQNAGTEKGVAAEPVIERVLMVRDVGVYPGKIRQLFEGESGDRAFVAFPDPHEGKVIAIGV